MGDFNATGITSVGLLNSSSLATLNSLKVTNAFNGKTMALTGTASMGTTQVNGDLNVSGNINGTFSSGTINIGTGGATISGIVPTANGGTNASSAVNALNNLGVTVSGVFNTALVGAGSLTSGMMAAPGAAVNGPYYQVYTDAAGQSDEWQQREDPYAEHDFGWLWRYCFHRGGRVAISNNWDQRRRTDIFDRERHTGGLEYSGPWRWHDKPGRKT